MLLFKKNNTYAKLSYNISDNGRNVHYLNKSTSSFMIIRCSGIRIVCIAFDDKIFLTEKHGFSFYEQNIIRNIRK